MKFTISKQAFTDGINQVQQVANTRTTLAILSNVLLTAKSGVLALAATDLDLQVTGEVGLASISEAGAVTLPARRLASIIRELPADTVEIEVQKNIASIRCGPSAFKLLGLSSDEFPAITPALGEVAFILDQTALHECLRKTSYAISTDATRYILNGILFEVKGQSLSLVATDGRRLAVVECIHRGAPADQEFVVPAKAVAELSRMLGDANGEVTCRVSGVHASFTAGSRVLVTRLIEGRFPNYRQVIPGEPKHRVSLDRETLLKSVSRAALMVNDKAPSVKLSFSPGALEVKASSPNVGEACETQAVDYQGKEMVIALNPDFLLAPLRNVSDKEVTLELIDEESPAVLSSDCDFRYVLMPMRLS